MELAILWLPTNRPYLVSEILMDLD